ncbi:alpha/beta hydrolase fold domain-containing protein [Phthorimaea operculella]|nr:alpha/beta hydrolase fold domain-containing protein [Phthorimaea operculella]
MEISLPRKSYTLLLRIPIFWHKTAKITIRRQSTVDLAHKIYGKLNGKPPIIILHGLLGSKRNWNSMSQKLKDSTDKAVIAVDARNHGESPHAPSHRYIDLAADVKRLMEKLQIKEAIVLGHSMGGRTAMVLALTEPAKVHNLIVVDISPVHSPSSLSDFFPRLMSLMKTITFDAGVKNVAVARKLAKTKLEESYLDMNSATAELALMNIGTRDGKISWMCNVDALKDYFTEIATFPSEMTGKVYQGPTLFVAGGESNFIPEDDEDAIRVMFPLAEIEVIPDASHNVHMDQPEEFSKIVTSFIKEYTM